MSDLERFRAEQLKDPEFLKYYLEMKVSSDISKAIVSYRMEHDLTQKELAAITGITQADISRLERCDGSPSLKTLKRLAKGMGLAVKVEFVSVESLLSEEINEN